SRRRSPRWATATPSRTWTPRERAATWRRSGGCGSGATMTERVLGVPTADEHLRPDAPAEVARREAAHARRQEERAERLPRLGGAAFGSLHTLGLLHITHLL